MLNLDVEHVLSSTSQEDPLSQDFWEASILFSLKKEVCATAASNIKMVLVEL